MDNYYPIQSERYTIYDWMVSDLNLKGAELLVYAVIYHFSTEKGDYLYCGTQEYLGELTNNTPRTIHTVIQSLIKKGHVIVRELAEKGSKKKCYKAITVSVGMSPEPSSSDIIERINDYNCLIIPGWMKTKLGLRGIVLTVYAVIFSCSQLKGNYYEGSCRYLEEWAETDRYNIIKAIQFLESQNLVLVEKYIAEDGKQHVRFSVTNTGRGR